MMNINDILSEITRHDVQKPTVIRIGNSSIINNDQYTTIITAYFSFRTSKHSSNKLYKKWASNMILSVNSPIVIFTDFKTKNFLINMFQHSVYKEKTNVVLFVYDNVWQLISQLEIDRNKSKNYYLNKYIYEQNSKDPEYDIHNPNLYAIWNLKVFLCDLVANSYNPFKSTFFIYNDFGAWRDIILPHWPDQQFVRELNQKLNSKIMLGQIDEFKNDNYDLDVIQGGFFAGNRAAFSKFKSIYYKKHDELLNDDKFVGKEQTILNMIAFENNNNEIARLKCFGLNCDEEMQLNPWFFYQIYFSFMNLTQCYKDKFSLLLNK